MEYLEQKRDAADLALSTMYEKQHLYVKDLVQQLPPGTMFPAVTRSVPVHPPSFGSTLLQGPFLLQPAPLSLSSGDGGAATDLTYLSFGGLDEETDHDTERLGVLMVAFQDGRIDICLDVDKVEARWESKQVRCIFFEVNSFIFIYSSAKTKAFQCLQSSSRLTWDSCPTLAASAPQL